jgi:hypothetical protein
MKRACPIGSLVLLIGCGGTSDIGAGPSAIVDASSDTGNIDAGARDQKAPEATASDARPEAEAGIPCVAPTDPSKTSLCVELVPEDIDFIPSDPDFDGKGQLTYEIFTTPDPTVAAAIATVIHGAGDNQIDLSKPIGAERFDGLPSAVYVRVSFADGDPLRGALWGGTWAAGTDYAKGLADSMPLMPVALTPGHGLTVSMKLWALRQLRVQLSRGADLSPAGDGEGPITVAAIDGVSYKAYGIARGCANINTTASMDLVGFVVGTGPYLAVAVLDDFGLGTGNAGFPPGSIVSFDPTSGASLDALGYGPRSYKVSSALSLKAVIDPPDGGADHGTCGVTDGGAFDASAADATGQ